MKDIILKKFYNLNPEYKKYQDGNGYIICIGQVFNLIIKSKYYQKPSYYTIDKALYKLAELCNLRHIDMVHISKNSSGLDMLRWNKVYSIILRNFNAFGINAIIYL